MEINPPQKHNKSLLLYIVFIVIFLFFIAIISYSVLNYFAGQFINQFLVAYLTLFKEIK